MRIPSAREPIEWQSTYPSDGRDQVRGIARQRRRLPHHVPRTAPPLAGEHRTRAPRPTPSQPRWPLSPMPLAAGLTRTDAPSSLRPAACALPDALRTTSYESSMAPLVGRLIRRALCTYSHSEHRYSGRPFARARHFHFPAGRMVVPAALAPLALFG